MSGLDYLYQEKDDLHRQKDSLRADVERLSDRITELYHLMDQLPQNQAWAERERQGLFNQIQGLKAQRQHAYEGINEIKRSIDRVKDDIATEKSARRGSRARGDWG